MPMVSAPRPTTGNSKILRMRINDSSVCRNTKELASAQELEDLNSDLRSRNSTDLSSSPSLSKSIDTAKSLSNCDSQASPSGMTSPLTTPKGLTEIEPSSGLDSLANLSLGQESKEETKTPDIYGPTLSDSFARLDPSVGWVKTSMGCEQLTLDGSLEPYCKSFPKAGLLWSGVAYRQQRWAQSTKENASGLSPIDQRLLPTPTSQPPKWKNIEVVDKDGNPPSHPNQRFYDKVSGRLVQKGIEHAIAYLPTPRASIRMGQSGSPTPSEITGKHGWQLENAIAGIEQGSYPLFLPTPTASDGSVGQVLNKNTQIYYTQNGTPRKISNQGVNGSVGLSRFVQLMLPTPKASDSHASGVTASPNQPKQGMHLSAAVRNLPTPQARDIKGVSGKGFQERGGNQNLPTYLDNRPTPSARDWKGEGREHQLPTELEVGNTKMLNPSFVAVMMGFHPMWINTSYATQNLSSGSAHPQSPLSLGSLVKKLEAFREKTKSNTKHSFESTSEPSASTSNGSKPLATPSAHNKLPSAGSESDKSSTFINEAHIMVQAPKREINTYEENDKESIYSYIEKRIEAESDPREQKEPVERLEFISPKDINLERGSQTRVAKNVRGLKDIKEKMSTPGVWRFDDPNDCPMLIELTEDRLVKLKGSEPFWVRTGELIPCIGHTRLEAGQELQELKSDLKMLCRIRKGTWSDVIYLSGTSDVNSAHPKTASDRSNAAYRWIEDLFERYGSLAAIPRRGKGKPKAGEPKTEEEWGSAKLSSLFGVCANTINNFYKEIEFARIIAPFPDGTRVRLTQDPDPTLPYFLKDKLGALGVVSGTVPNEGLFVRFDCHNPECVHPRFLSKSDAPLPEVPLPPPPLTTPSRPKNGGGSSSSGQNAQARSLGVQTGSQALPSSPTNLDVPPEEANAEPPTPSPTNTEESRNKSEEQNAEPSPQQNTNTSSTTTEAWIPEVGEWAQVKDEHDFYPGKFVRITTYPYPNRTDVAIVEIQGRPDQRDRIETKFLKPVYEEEEDAPKTISTEDIISEITIGVRQLSPDELSQVLVQAQPTESHKKAIKSALFKDKDADLVEAARTVVENIGRYTPEELDALERAIASVKSAIAN